MADLSNLIKEISSAFWAYYIALTVDGEEISNSNRVPTKLVNASGDDVDTEDLLEAIAQETTLQDLKDDVISTIEGKDFAQEATLSSMKGLLDSGDARTNIGDSLSHGSQDVSSVGTAEQLPSESCHEVTVIAKQDNTGYVYLGDSSVSNSSYGVKLAPGDAFTFNINNADLLYVDADNDGEGVTYIAI